LDKGSILLAPAVDTSLNTAFGKVKIKAGSVVLVLSTSNGVAVFNFDDQQRGAVTISAPDKDIELFPGMSAMVTSKAAGSFEEVNPAQLFAYRNIVGTSAGSLHKVFVGEFSVPAAIQSVIPLKQLLSSHNVNAKRLSAHLLKTTAANLQVHSNGGGYQQMPHPSLTAWAQ
jgi:hypothetical protein